MRNWKKLAALLCATTLLVSLLTACGGSASYNDGTYTAQSSAYENFEAAEDEGGDGYGVVTITVKDNKIVACEFKTYELDGTLKDEDYGKQNGAVANQDYYNKAQRAVQGSQNYAEQLAQKGELKAVDAVSGATISYGQFQEAVELALDQAKK